jgi:hypothetical protein
LLASEDAEFYQGLAWRFMACRIAMICGIHLENKFSRWWRRDREVGVFGYPPPPSPTLKVLRSAGFAKMVCKRFMAKILDTKVLITKGLGGRDLKSRDRHCLD